MSDNQACCACRTVRCEPEKNTDGTLMDRWVCTSCGTRFVKVAALFGAAEMGRQWCATERDEMRYMAKHIDDLLLRFAFDAGALSEDVVSGLSVDPWGILADFRRTFGLAPTMTQAEYAAWHEKTYTPQPAPPAQEKNE